MLWMRRCPLKIIWETFRSPHRLFRNIQVINWHKYKESTNKNAKYVNSLFVCWGVIFQNSKVTRSIIWLLSQAHAFEHDSFLRNGRHGDVQHVQQKKSEYEIFMKREKIYLTFTFKGWFSSAILNFLFKSQTNCYWWFAFYHMLMTMTMIMSNILSSCLDLRSPKPDPNPTRNPDF